MSGSGVLNIRATCQRGVLTDLAVDLRRPQISRLFISQAPEVVVKTVPYLYTLCAQAQRATAAAALAAVQGVAAHPLPTSELWLEFLHENFWRLLLDWPPALGLPPAREAFIAWRGLRNTPDGLAATQALIKETVRPLGEKCLEKLVDRGEPSTAGSDALAPRQWLDNFLGNTNMASARPASIRRAFQARLAAVDHAATALAAGADFPVAACVADDWGVAQSLTSRGVLTHAVQLRDGKVAQYHVQAPTDALFADATALGSLLAGQCFLSRGAAHQALEQAILCLDPCLPYQLELHDA